MKRIFTMTGIAFTLMLFASLPKTASAQPRTDISINYQTFYDELDPYGEWMEYPDYGYVWVPDAGADFRPYETRGHWVWSDDYEWMWVSDYDWGWAPFHYGRWLMDPAYGWIWVPGYEWSPAWVAWRDGGDYYGWAPLRPGFNISININLGGYNPPMDYWCFAPRRYITSPRIWDYCAPRRNNVTIINQTTIINNYNYNRNVWRTGPGRRDAERYAGRINSVRFRESSSPGRSRMRGNEVSVYRPRVQQDNSRQYTPRRFERYDGNGRNNGTVRNNPNNLPQRRERMETGDIGRRTDRQRPDNGNAIGNNRRFDRNNGNDGSQPNTDRQNRRFERPDNNSNGQARPQRNREYNPGQQRDVFERRSDPNDQRRMQQNERRMQQREIYNNRNNGNERPNRQMEQPRQFERRQEQQQPRQFERRQEQQQQPRQFERRQEQQQPRQFERRQEQPQQQPRQFERRNEGGGGNERGGGNGNGHGRRGR